MIKFKKHGKKLGRDLVLLKIAAIELPLATSLLNIDKLTTLNEDLVIKSKIVLFLMVSKILIVNCCSPQFHR